MKTLKHLTLCIAMAASLGTAHAQKEQVIQDGIAVKPLSRVRVIVPEEQLNEQAAQQYLSLIHI